MNDPGQDQFVPLHVAATGRHRGDTHLTLLRAAHGPLPPQTPVAQPAARAAIPPAACEPKVTLQRDGERVTAIHVECACGRVIELACEY